MSVSKAVRLILFLIFFFQVDKNEPLDDTIINFKGNDIREVSFIKLVRQSTFI